MMTDYTIKNPPLLGIQRVWVNILHRIVTCSRFLLAATFFDPFKAWPDSVDAAKLLEIAVPIIFFIQFPAAQGRASTGVTLQLQRRSTDIASSQPLPRLVLQPVATIFQL